MSLERQFSQQRAWSKGPGIADGADAEHALLGAPKIPQNERKEGYMSYGEAMAYAKQFQPSVFERSKPMKALRDKVALYCSDTNEPVKFYTAVGTPLDIYHGVDAFFEQGNKIATLDVSLRVKDSYKADVLITATLSNEGEISIDPVESQQAAEEIARILSTPRPSPRTH